MSSRRPFLPFLAFLPYVVFVNRPIQATSIASECVPNIALRGRRRRRLMGVVWLAITAVAFLLLASGHSSVALFALIAPLAGMTAIYFLQAKEKT